jgi:polar amino acid transport system substrate-binding protein
MGALLDSLRRRGAVMVAIVLLAVLALAPIGAASAPSLSLVSTSWPPFTNGPGQPRFALDLVEAALGRIHINSTTTIVSPADFTSSLLSGKYDGSGAAWRDPVRERMLIFSLPYLENRLVLVGRHGADVSAAKLAGLAGKKIGIVEGYAYGDAIETGGPAWVRLPGEEECLSALLKGTVDYTLMDELVVNYIVSNYPKESEAKLAIGTTPVLTRELYLAVSKMRPDAESIVERFNQQLRGMIKDRTYHKLLHVDWIRADIDGDGVPEFVPLTDRPGPAAPTRSYTLFTTPGATATPPEKSKFYVGGNIYSDWASVPDAYKRGDANHPDPRRSTASIFKFEW